ncbi:MAG: NUDIX domain-containing protein [Caldisericia bacterium]|jgi:tRNA nucleotidyltransferase (CCA-adding enzyme)|nr:NUDIX domain-containing protein [Caldisericia bacterium]
MKNLISSGGVIINQDKVLILKRDKTWVFPKGKVKENENLIETAKREIFEETGIKVDEPLFFIGTTKYKFVKENEIYNKEVHYYLFKVDTLNVNIETSFIGFGWFYFDEGLKILTFKNDKKLFKNALKKLKEANL